jgi:hypothetical protein
VPIRRRGGNRSDNRPRGTMGGIRKFWVSKQSNLTVPSTTPINNFPYTTVAILQNDLVAANPRSVQLRRVIVRFDPYSAGIAGAAAPNSVDAQLTYTTIDGLPVPLTGMVPLSTTKVTTLSFSVPQNVAEVRTSNDTAQQFSIIIMNRFSAPGSQVYFQAQFHYDVYPDISSVM